MSEDMFENEHTSETTDTMTNAGNQAPYNPTQNQPNGYNPYQNGNQVTYQADNGGYNNENSYNNGNVYQNANAYNNVNGNPNANAYNNTNAYQNMGATGADETWKQQYLNPQQPKKEGGNGFGIAALVLGIISLILFCTCINLPLAVLAIVFAIVQMVKGGSGKGMAIGGLITAIASIVCFVVFYVLISIGAIDASSDLYYDTPYEDFEDDMDDFFDNLDYSYSVDDAI